jgi:two-component sensor histidine kinase/PAS domain-containing protein
MGFSGEQALSLLDNLADGLLVQTVPTGEVAHVNAGFLGLLACDRTLLEGRPDGWIEHIYPEDQSPVRRWWQELLVHPTATERTYRILQPGRKLCWVQCRSLPLKTQPSQPPYLATLHVDVTTQQPVLASSSSQEETLQNLFSPFLIGIGCCDAVGRLVWVNEAFEALLDYAPGALLGHRLKDLIALSAPGTGAWGWGTSPRPWSNELELLTGSGQRRQVLVTVAPLGFQFHPKATCICLVQDINQYKQTEHWAQPALPGTEVLIAEIHHRVKNNLQIISSLLELQANRTQDLYTRAILFSSQDRVLAMSLIHETLYQGNNIARINFADYIRHLVGSLSRAYIPDQGIDFNLSLDTTATLSTDLAVPLGLILHELVTNALNHGRFSSARRGAIVVELKALENSQYEVSVQQTSSCLPDGFAMDNPSSMGLQIVKLLTLKIGAQLTVEPNPPTFKVVFSTNE